MQKNMNKTTEKICFFAISKLEKNKKNLLLHIKIDFSIYYQFKIMKEHVGAIRCLSIHRNFNVLISGGDAKSLLIWDISSGKLLKKFHRNPISVNRMVLNSRYLIVSSPSDPGQLVSYDFYNELNQSDKDSENLYFS